MIYDNADEVVEELFQSLFSRDQTRLETSKRDSGLSFYCVNSLYYKNYKIDWGGYIYIDYLDWIN